MADEEQTLTVTVPEYAKATGLSETCVYNAVNRGELPSIRVGRAVRLPRWLLGQLKEPA